MLVATHTQQLSWYPVSLYQLFLPFVCLKYSLKNSFSIVLLGENLWNSKIFWLEIQGGYIHCEIWAVYRQKIRSALVVSNL